MVAGSEKIDGYVDSGEENILVLASLAIAVKVEGGPLIQLGSTRSRASQIEREILELLDYHVVCFPTCFTFAQLLCDICNELPACDEICHRMLHFLELLSQV